jgi:hypothetical protein
MGGEPPNISATGPSRPYSGSDLPGRDPAVAAIVIETALEALAHKAVIEGQDLLAGGLMERETLSVIGGYVLRPAGKRRRPRSWSR